jgi:hypothetical protein
VRTLQKIRKRRETRVASAAVVESACPHKGELCSVTNVVINLAVIQLVCADELRRREEFEAAVAQSAVGREARLLGEPARNRRRADGMAVARREASAGFFDGVAAIVGRKRVEDFMERIGLVADCARARCKGATAGPAAIQPDRFELLGAAALRSDAPAVAGWTALGRLDGGERGLAAPGSVVRVMRGI